MAIGLPTVMSKIGDPAHRTSGSLVRRVSAQPSVYSHGVEIAPECGQLPLQVLGNPIKKPIQILGREAPDEPLHKGKTKLAMNPDYTPSYPVARKIVTRLKNMEVTYSLRVQAMRSHGQKTWLYVSFPLALAAAVTVTNNVRVVQTPYHAPDVMAMVLVVEFDGDKIEQ